VVDGGIMVTSWMNRPTLFTMRAGRPPYLPLEG
jgi:hypothetical protein